MPSLRDFRDRIVSVKSTRKITSAMKMVAASKLRRAQAQAEASQPYARSMAAMMARVAKNVIIHDGSAKLLRGTGSDRRHLLIVVTADRGLCAGFNANLVKSARRMMADLESQGKEVQIICAGRKARDFLRRDRGSAILKSFTGITGKNRVDYADAQALTDFILEKFDAGAFDVCTLLYNEFKSVLVQKPTAQQLIPFHIPQVEGATAKEAGPVSPYDFEPAEEEILNALLPRNIGVQVFRALLDSSAGEQAARMTAMDSATRNAGDMINALTLRYNRARQAYITKELIEIISGAEAV
ncbi:MAG: F0F1 ATP synthase subunit gamma [Alphaproteobacteria bacterium]|nr:F0F1 ATP synthase subunit gamma [Alphaproteobacteria bacterium]